MKFQWYLNLCILILINTSLNSLKSQNGPNQIEVKSKVPKALILYSNEYRNKEGNQLIYNETKNIVFSRLKKNLEKFDINKSESNNKQFSYILRKNSIEIRGENKSLIDSNPRPDFILLLETNLKSTNLETSEILIATFNSCNYSKIKEIKLQYNTKSNWIKNDKQFVKIDSILQQFIFNTLIENNNMNRKGIEINCEVEFNLEDSNNLDFSNYRKDKILDSIENWILINSIENQYYLKTVNNRIFQFNAVRMPLFNHQMGVCVDVKLFFEPIIKQIPQSELVLQNLPMGINAVIRITE